MTLIIITIEKPVKKKLCTTINFLDTYLSDDALHHRRRNPNPTINLYVTVQPVHEPSFSSSTNFSPTPDASLNMRHIIQALEKKYKKN
jgi:uncharacterized protein (DUF2461 family)